MNEIQFFTKNYQSLNILAASVIGQAQDLEQLNSDLAEIGSAAANQLAWKAYDLSVMLKTFGLGLKAKLEPYAPKPKG